MNYATDTNFLIMIFVLPSLFGLTLIGEGVNKIMNYDNRGWINVTIGAIFVVILIVAYLMVTTNTIT